MMESYMMESSKMKSYKIEPAVMPLSTYYARDLATPGILRLRSCWSRHTEPMVMLLPISYYAQ